MAARARERIKLHSSDKSPISFISAYKRRKKVANNCVKELRFQANIFLHVYMYAHGIWSVHHLIVFSLFVLCHSGNEECHFGNVSHHLIHNFIKVALLAQVQWGIKGHLIVVEYQLDLKEWCNALGWVCVVYEVLQGAAYRTGQAHQNHPVHIVCVSLPLTTVWVWHTEQWMVLLNNENWVVLLQKHKFMVHLMVYIMCTIYAQYIL